MESAICGFKLSYTDNNINPSKNEIPITTSQMNKAESMIYGNPELKDKIPFLYSGGLKSFELKSQTGQNLEELRKHLELPFPEYPRQVIIL